jgi:predicted Zn-dependent protease
MQGRLAQAQALLEAVVTLDPGFRAAHVALAKVYFRQKRLKDAEQQGSIAATLEERKPSETSPWGLGGVGGPDSLSKEGSSRASKPEHENN